MSLYTEMSAARLAKLDATAGNKLKDLLTTVESTLSAFSESLPWTPETTSASIENQTRQKRAELTAAAIMEFLIWQTPRDTQAMATKMFEYLQGHNQVAYVDTSLQAGTYPVIKTGSGVIGTISYN